jgi:hypothetical protein
MSGASNISCSCSMSSMMRSASIRLNIQHEQRNRQTERTAKSPKTAVCPRIIPRTGQFCTVSELKPSHTLHDSLRQTVDGYPHECRAEPLSSETKTMKTKTWTVIANTGKQADLESGPEKKAVQRPTHITSSEFVHWLAAESRIDDDNLRSLFKR